MPASLLHAVSRLAAGADDPRTDAHLVAAFLKSTDQAAFAELVRRHGPTVLGVCRRFLGATPDAEDAFQATFLVLVNRARGTEWRESLGPWLYGVAFRVARRARSTRAKRLANERQVPAMSDQPVPSSEPDDASAVLDEELAALPAIYRQPLILCEIQGTSRRVAAQELGLSEGTLSSRLARGRKMLRARLDRRGLAPVTAGLALAVPASLATATVRNAVHTLTRTAGAVPAGVLFLTEGAVKSMIVKWKLAGAMIAACVGLTGLGAWQTSAQPPTAPNQPVAALPPALPPDKPAALEKKIPAVSGPEPIATIFGDVPVTREAFADHLIRRYGKKELDLFVNTQIIAHAFGRRDWKITGDDVLAALDEDCKSLGMTRAQFAKDVLPRQGKTLDEWAEDVVAPRLMLARLCNAKSPPVTEAELRRAFDAKYGEKISCRVITWTKDKGAEARKAYEEIRENENAFEDHARRQSEPTLAAVGGRVAPIPRTPATNGDNDTHRATAKLQAGEISPLVVTKTGFIVVKCDRVIPADKSKSFEAEKPMLLPEVVNARLEKEIPKLFDELKREAKPKYHLTFTDAMILPKPLPAPKK
ncbi:ECF RNA polymerase sigma factor SigE [Gemmata sp. SH-PL17]|uniref:sigma-70 family RNA polymerase sigma factor n=1 Tax=Gemmata sp. SH-PL17 TaxID=1630693 RepID=UPI00078C6B54|nr:sigma-70 family RNA polymerase sigma factor [Gemmata sp. SH-PL17]AMV29354.1 ECF RNA polymerase sigma factor SigE [Gemmata sp. SH-PL17]